jgi:OsmC-like protein
VRSSTREPSSRARGRAGDHAKPGPTPARPPRPPKVLAWTAQSFAPCRGRLRTPTARTACAGVTLRAVTTSLGISLAGGTVTAEGDLDFRGTLAVSKEAPVGFSSVRLSFDLDTGATAEQLQTLIRLTERYCVVYQTLAHPPKLTITEGPTPGS